MTTLKTAPLLPHGSVKMDEHHHYFVNGVEHVSVSKFLEPFDPFFYERINPKSDKFDKRFYEKVLLPAQKRGTLVHKLAEQIVTSYFQNKIANLKNWEHVKEYVRLCYVFFLPLVKELRLFATEGTVVSPTHLIAGTIDYLFYHPTTKRSLLVDLKTGKLTPQNKRQMATYRGLLAQNKLKVDQVVLISLHPHQPKRMVLDNEELDLIIKEKWFQKELAKGIKTN